MTDRGGSWRQGFKSLTRLNLTQACERLDFFQSGRVQFTDFKTFQLVYRRLRRVVRTAERIVGTTLPTLQELYLSRVSKRAGKITLDPSHPAHSLFDLLPSGRRYRALSTRTTRHRNSFFPQAIHLMNT